MGTDPCKDVCTSKGPLPILHPYNNRCDRDRSNPNQNGHDTTPGSHPSNHHAGKYPCGTCHNHNVGSNHNHDRTGTRGCNCGLWGDGNLSLV